MIVIPRLEGEALTIGENITITVLEIDGDDVLLEIDAPGDTPIDPCQIEVLATADQSSRDNQG